MLGSSLGSQREGGRKEEGRKAEQNQSGKSGHLQFLTEPQMPPLGTTWVYLPPRKTPLQLLRAQSEWVAKPGGGHSPGRRGPQREMMTAKSHPKLLMAQTCSWGGARNLRGPEGGPGFPCFHSPEMGGGWRGVTQNRSQGQSISGDESKGKRKGRA